MRLILAVSADGYLARQKNDRMDWLGSTDKSIFRILTGVGSWCATSAKTAECMPKTLQGRELTVLSRKGMSLAEFAEWKPEGWLLGGPTLAMAALETGLLTEVHMCRSDRYAYPDCMVAGAIGDCVTRWLRSSCGAWLPTMTTRINDVTMERWTVQDV